MKKAPQHIICIGDSLTAGLPDPELDKWVTRLALGLDSAYPQRHSVFNRGFNGATSTAAYERIESEVAYLLPAVVLVELGVNDALVRPTRRRPQVGVEEFKSNLREYQRYFSEHQSPMVLVAAHHPGVDQRQNIAPQQMYIPGNGKSYAENYEPYHQAILEIGSELNVPVLDIPAELERRGWTMSGRLMEDGLHLNSKGHQTYAEVMLEPLKKILESL